MPMHLPYFNTYPSKHLLYYYVDQPWEYLTGPRRITDDHNFDPPVQIQYV